MQDDLIKRIARVEYDRERDYWRWPNVLERRREMFISYAKELWKGPPMRVLPFNESVLSVKFRRSHYAWALWSAAYSFPSSNTIDRRNHLLLSIAGLYGVDSKTTIDAFDALVPIWAVEDLGVNIASEAGQAIAAAAMINAWDVCDQLGAEARAEKLKAARETAKTASGRRRR